MILRLLHSIRLKRATGEAWDEVHTITDEMAEVQTLASGYWITHPPHGYNVTFVPFSNVRSHEQQLTEPATPTDTSPPSTSEPAGSQNPESTSTHTPTVGTKRRGRPPKRNPETSGT